MQYVSSAQSSQYRNSSLTLIFDAIFCNLIRQLDLVNIRDNSQEFLRRRIPA